MSNKPLPTKYQETTGHDLNVVAMIDDVRLSAPVVLETERRRAKADELAAAQDYGRRVSEVRALTEKLMAQRTYPAQNVSRETSGPIPVQNVSRETSGGVKFDQDKPRMDLVPVRPLVDEAKVWAFGAAKYSANNWRQGLDWSRPYAAALRHLTAWWGGENTDPETGFSHLAHARCCIAMLQEFETTRPELDNRPQ